MPGVRRLHPARDRRRRATHLPAELSGSRIMRMPDQVTRLTARLPVAVGRAASLHRATTMVPGHGVTVASKGKLPHGHRPRDPAACNARVVRDSRRHSEEGHGRKGKEVRASVPQPRGNTGNWRPGWRSSSGDRGGQQPAQQQYSSGQRRWSQGSADQQPAATVNIPPPRRRGCYVCGQPGCHADFHGPEAVSP